MQHYVVLYKWLYVAASSGKDMREKEVNKNEFQILYAKGS